MDITFEQVQAAVRRQEAAKAAYDAAKAAYERRFFGMGSAARSRSLSRTPPAFSALDTPEGREYDAAAGEFDELIRQLTENR